MNNIYCNTAFTDIFLCCGLGDTLSIELLNDVAYFSVFVMLSYCRIISLWACTTGGHSGRRC